VPLIDLVLGTVGRTEEPTRFLHALRAQTYRDFRLIVVDQNGDDRLAPILSNFEGAFPILQVNAQPGLSRARNVALKHLEGDVVGFPDDDCWYPPDLLQSVATFLSTNAAWDGLGGRAADELGNPAAGQFDATPGAMTMFNLWRRVASYTLFLRRGVIDAVGPFDEALGVGSGTPWGGGEDLDYVMRSLHANCSVYYDPTVAIHHPQKREQSSHPDARQGYAYGAGFGRALRRNRLPWWFAVYYFGRAFGASALSLVAGHPLRARFFWAVGKGRVRGWTASS
jgi:glycosyltransferase involved in cell wall biosynthesis